MSPRTQTTPVRLALYAAAVLAALAVGPRGPVYWDSFGYVAQSISGQVGGLALGRPLFVLVSHALAGMLRSAGLHLFALEPALRTFWLAVAALAAPATHALARSAGLSARGATLAGLAVALSPAMAHTSAAVLTDAPSLAVTLLAFVLGARAVAPETEPRGWWAFAAGALLGAAFGLREQAIAQAVVLALMVPLAPRGARIRVTVAMMAGFALVAAAPLLYVASTQRGYVGLVTGWIAAMQREREGHPYGLRDALAFAGWLIALGPATVLAAAAGWVRLRRVLFARWSIALAVCAPALLQLILLGGYQDIAYSPRYLLSALPGALALPSALWAERCVGHSRRRTAACLLALLLPLAAAVPLVRERERPLRAAMDTLPASLASLPPGSVVVTGQLCPAVALIDRIWRAEGLWQGPGPRWQTVCPGWAWPQDVGARLDRARAEGRTVVLDLRDAAWLGAGQQARRSQIVRYAAAHRGEVLVWR